MPHVSWVGALVASGTAALGNRDSVRLRFDLTPSRHPQFASIEAAGVARESPRSLRRDFVLRHRAGPQVGHQDVNPTAARSVESALWYFESLARLYFPVLLNRTSQFFSPCTSRFLSPVPSQT